MHKVFAEINLIYSGRLDIKIHSDRLLRLFARFKYAVLSGSSLKLLERYLINDYMPVPFVSMGVDNCLRGSIIAALTM